MNWPYAATMSVSIAVGFWLLRRFQQPLGLSAKQKGALALGAFIGAMIGGKLPFVLADPATLLSGAGWFLHGKTIVFGLVGAYLGVEVAKACAGVTVRTGDSFAVPAAVAIAIGRIGCFEAGCCYGTETALPWGVIFHDGVPRHPTQLYEAAFHLAMAAVLLVLVARGAWRGQLFKVYVIAYLAYRFASEWIRPEPRVAGSLTAYQLCAALLIALFAWLAWRDHVRYGKKPAH